jgi:hypothetical protein
LSRIGTQTVKGDSGLWSVTKENFTSRAIVAVAALGTAWFGMTMLVLSLPPTDYNAVSQMASDYGVGRFATEMNLGFFVGGVGLLAFGLAISELPRSAAYFCSSMVWS